GRAAQPARDAEAALAGAERELADRHGAAQVDQEPRHALRALERRAGEPRRLAAVEAREGGAHVDAGALHGPEGARGGREAAPRLPAVGDVATALEAPAPGDLRATAAQRAQQLRGEALEIERPWALAGRR